MKKTILLIGLLFYLAHPGVCQDPDVKIINPGPGARLESCSDIKFELDIQQGSAGIKTVELYRNGAKIKSTSRLPFRYTLREVPQGLYEFFAKVIDKADNEAVSDTHIVHVGGIAPGNLILNGEFNCEKWPWRFDLYEGAQGTFEIWPDMELTGDAPGAYIDIREMGSVFWAIQLMQPFVLKKGHTYEIRFAAEADEEKEIEVHISQDYEPWTPHWTQKVPVHEPGIYGPFLFECTVDDPKTMFKFVLGGNDIPVYIDAVQCVDLMWTDVEKKPDGLAPAGFSLGRNHPNPFNGQTRVPFILKKSGPVKLTITDVLGKIVFTDSKNLSAGSHFFKWNGRDDTGRCAASGCYFYSLETAAERETGKMLLLK